MSAPLFLDSVFVDAISCLSTSYSYDYSPFESTTGIAVPLFGHGDQKVESASRGVPCPVEVRWPVFSYNNLASVILSAGM